MIPCLPWHVQRRRKGKRRTGNCLAEVSGPSVLCAPWRCSIAKAQVELALCLPTVVQMSERWTLAHSPTQPRKHMKNRFSEYAKNQVVGKGTFEIERS